MTVKGLIAHHKIFFTFLVLFFIVGAIDIFNLDRLIYKAICDVVSPVSGSPCPPFYDLPIWHVYLSLAILAGLYHVHDELRTHTKHLSSHKR
jgi:hypothetical protein